jgi:tRNA nucleotidyltransferase/poly(A) polymerase
MTRHPGVKGGTLRPYKHPAWLGAYIVAICLVSTTAGQAQTPAMDELKGKIFDARMAEKTFSGGLKYCNELNGKNFYFQLRNRILNLEEYFQSLENLVKAQVFNPAKRRPWSLEDAKERWEEVKRQAQEDREKCALVQNLPALEKQLQELQQKAAAAEKAATSEKKE